MKEFFNRCKDSALDLVMCGMMNGIQMRHRLPRGSLAAMEKYVAECEPLKPDDFYAMPPAEIASLNGDRTLRWRSPVQTLFPENNVTHVDLYPCDKGWSAPTVFMLHALMSTSDTGYKEWARKFNLHGWNACFLHLPYHYSRVPHGCFNGELAISPDLVRTGEALRQGVIELRQLMRHLRDRGCPFFGLWATSYGGWIGALLTFVEADFRFLALMSPIVNIDHAIWRCPASIWVRHQLRRHGITPSLVGRHYHLSSPLHNLPLCGGRRAIIAAGLYDMTALPEDVEQLHKHWTGSEYLAIAQGHFGYRIMPETFRRLEQRGMFAI